MYQTEPYNTAVIRHILKTHTYDFYLELKEMQSVAQVVFVQDETCQLASQVSLSSVNQTSPT